MCVSNEWLIHTHVTWLKDTWVRVFQWVMSHMRCVSMSHVTNEWGTSRMNKSCDTYEWVMAHIWMRHVTHMDEACHTYEWVMSHVWMSHVTRMNESCHTYITCHKWMSRVTCMQMSHVTYKWVSLMNESCDVYIISQMNESCHMYVNAPCHLYMNESCDTWVSHAVSCCVFAVTPAFWSCHTCEWVMSHMSRNRVTHMNESFHIYVSIMSQCDAVRCRVLQCVVVCCRML